MAARIVFDLTNWLGLACIAIGAGHRYGWDVGLAVGGSLALALNFATVSAMRKA